MTYNHALTIYRRVLEANPGKAMLIGDDCYAVLINGCLYGAYPNLVGAVDLEKIFNFDPEAWDGDCECWIGDISGMQTAFCLSSPSLVKLATAPTAVGSLNQGEESC